MPVLMKLVNSLVTADYEGRMPACEDDRYLEDLIPIESAVKALAQIGDTRAVPILLQDLKSTLLRSEAAQALTKFGQAALAPLMKMFKTESDENIRYHLQETLLQLGWRPGQIRL